MTSFLTLKGPSLLSAVLQQPLLMKSATAAAAAFLELSSEEEALTFLVDLRFSKKPNRLDLRSTWNQADGGIF